MKEQFDIVEVIKKIQENASKEAEEIFKTSLEHLSEKNCDFKSLESEIRHRILNLGRSIFEEALNVVGTGYEGAVVKCECGAKKKFINHREKSLTTLLGNVSFQRAYYHCAECGKGWIPLDEKYDVVDTKFSPQVREAIGLVDAEVAFERGNLLLEKLLDLKISKQKSEYISEGFGSEIEHRLQEEEKKLWEYKDLGSESKEVAEQFYVSIDGTTVNTYEGWKETKIGAIFTARTVDNSSKPIREKTEYLGGFEHSEEFGKRVWIKAHKMGMELAKKVIVIGDGAKWIWNEANTHFPGAVQIVDWYHAVEKLWEISKIVYGEKSNIGSHWVAKNESKLAEGKVEKVILSLNRLKPSNEKTKQKVEQAIGYFSSNKERMRYKKFKEQGYFIGSGVVESGCKHVVADRLKKSGMRWSIEGANAILQLRICILNGEWETFWKWRRSKYRAAA